VSDLEALHSAPPLAGVLAAAGWPAGHPALSEAAPVAARGHNLVFIAPPAPAWARPVLAGVAGRLLAERSGPVLALCPAECVDEWSRVAERVTIGTALRLAAVQSPGRLTRLLRTDTVDLVFTTPDIAFELVRRAALKLDGLGGVLLLWPEAWGGDDLLSTLLQDVPRETQRIVVTADPAGSAPLIERYCWRAPVVDLIGAPVSAAATPVRSTPVAWRGRLDAVAEAVDQLDPETVTVWMADLAERDAVARYLAAAGVTATITNADADRSSLIVAYDLPTPAGLIQLAGAGEVLLLVPPGTEAYAGRIAPRRRPVHARGQLERARAEVDTTRRTVAGILERGPAPQAFIAIAPLLERHEASAVAAALYELWDAARLGAAEPVPAARAAEPAARLWVGIGKRDSVTPNDLVGTLIKELAVPREAVGRVEIRETFSIVELGTGVDAAGVAERMTGKTIRKRRLVARLDRKK
jgi:hypothetical protein